MEPANETLLRGGNLLTIAAPARAEAVLVRGDRIAAVGSEAACRAAAHGDPEVVDLGGLTLIPGFVDAHCHPLMFGQFQTWTDCSWEAAPDIDGVVRRLRDAAEALPGGSPVRGHGFHHGNVADQRFLSRHDLDRVATDREVLVFHSSGHGAFVNGWTLDTLGIDATVPDPAGGHFDRDADGTPQGGVWNSAADVLTGPGGVKIGNHGPNFHLSDTMERQLAQLCLAQDTFLAAGITSVVDAQVTSRELLTYLRLREAGGLRFRVNMLVISSLLEQLELLGLGGRLGDDQLAFAGLKLYVDGALTGATAHFSKPYCCDPLDHGYDYHDPEELRSLISRAHRLGLQTGTHAQGDAAIGLALDALAAALAEQPRHDHRHRIEHCGYPTAEHLARIADLGLYPIPQPQYVYRYGDELERVLGDRAHRLMPLGEFAAAGIPVVLSSDAPVTPPRPLEAIYAAVARRTLSGQRLGAAEQAVDVHAALHGHTLGAAASIHREREIGSLEVGKLADFAVLSDDPTRVALDDLMAITVEQTWIGGRPVAISARV